jgi:predicted metalloprotease with PDZ domain
MNSSALDIEYFLAHEISHKFVEFDGTVVNATSISEGWAEHYSTRLLWRNNFITDQQYLDVENKTVSYYYNASDACNYLMDTEVQASPWGPLAVQKVPYGRSLIYLHNIDADMRERYHGTKSVNTITMEIIQRKESGLSHSVEDLFNILNTYSGESTVDYYNEVASGKLFLELRQGTLSPCFKVMQTSEGPVVYQWEMNKRSTSFCII